VLTFHDGLAYGVLIGSGFGLTTGFALAYGAIGKRERKARTAVAKILLGMSATLESFRRLYSADPLGDPDEMRADLSEYERAGEAEADGLGVSRAIGLHPLSPSVRNLRSTREEGD
jgi:hypothetical protein